MPSGTSRPSSSTRRTSTNASARPKQLVPRWRHDAGGRAGLGHRPGLDEREAEAGFERRMQLLVDAGAKGPAHAMIAVGRPCRSGALGIGVAGSRLARVRGQDGGVHQHRRHHPEVVDDRRPALAHALPPCLRMKAVELDQAAAGDDDDHRRERHRVDMVQRERCRDALAIAAHFADAVEACVPATGGEEVGVGENAALRSASGAGGVEEGALGRSVDRVDAAGAGGSRRGE